jgi:hypothetical protein
LERTTSKAKLSQRGREARIVATSEDEAIVSVPDVVRMTVVGIEPEVVAVVLHVEDVAVAVPIGCVQSASRATAR